MRVEATAWYHTTELTFVDYLALVRRHLWRARCVVSSAAEPEFGHFPGRPSNACSLPSVSHLMGQRRV
jgi:hypothetical protein